MVSWSVGAYLAFLALLAVERIVELQISRRNARWALERGGVEVGAAHFRWMKLLHVGFFVGCAAEVIALERPLQAALGLPMLLLAIAAQLLRYWAIASLGRHWNVRVIVVPGSRPVSRGPYRYLRHPNYLAVIIEGIAVPLIHGAYLTAIAFSALNAVVLAVRIRCEEATMSAHCDGYGDTFGPRRRLLPGRGKSLAAAGGGESDE